MKVASRIPAKVLVASVLFAIALPAFYQQTLGTGGSDIPTHFGIARDTQIYPYATYSILSTFVGGLFWAGANSLAVGWVAIVLLSACVALEGLLSFDILSNRLPKNPPIRLKLRVQGRVTFQTSSSSVPELRTTLAIGQKR